MALYANLYGPETLDYPNSAHAANLLVKIRNADSDLPALLYTDRTKTVLAANPLHTDSLGNLSFWAEPGEYLVVFGSGELHVSLPDHPDEPESGGGGVDGILTHVQSTPSASWSIVHNKGRAPLLAVYIAGELVIPDSESSSSETSIVFPIPTSGFAVLL